MAPRIVIVMPLTTTLTISSLPSPLPTALEAFIPVYNARPDGSLITLGYMREIQYTNLRLFVVGIFLMLFIRNTVISVDYLRRSRSKDKTLFYLLVASQILGPVSFISLAASYLSSEADCKIVHTVSQVSTALSQALLITGILGIKAYRCLDQSRVVLFIISILQVISTALLCFDVGRLHSYRMASGVCDASVEVHLSILILFFQSFFICVCFIYTVWRASAYSAAQGRLSLAGTLESVGDDFDCPINPANAELLERRGWWDYVPEQHITPEVQGSIPDNHSVFSHISRALGLADSSNTGLQRISSIRSVNTHSEHPSPPPPRAASHPRCVLSRPSEKALPSTHWGGNEPTSQRFGTLGRISRIRFVRAAMRDELLHTAAVAVNCILTVILITVGFLKFKLIWSPMVWQGVNWMITSLIVMHSFSRVVKRHEREAILCEPSAWDLRDRRTSRRPEWQPTPSISPFSVASQRRTRRHVDLDTLSATRSWEDPFRGSFRMSSGSSAAHDSMRASEVPDPFRGSIVDEPFQGDERTEGPRNPRNPAVKTPSAVVSSPPPTPAAEFFPKVTQNV